MESKLFCWILKWGTLELARGDQIRFTESNRHIRAYKGEIGRIMAIDGDVLTVRSQSGSDIKVDTQEFNGLDYGYTLSRQRAMARLWSQRPGF